MGNIIDRDIPTLIPNISIPIKAICASYIHSILLDIDGGVWVFGYNGYHRLGLDDDRNIIDKPTLLTGISTPIKAISSKIINTLLLDKNGDVWMIEGKSNRNSITLIPDIDTPIKAISAGYDHYLLIDIKGRVWAFGDNGYGQLGNDTDTEGIIDITIPIKAVSAGGKHSLLLDINGQVWSFGLNEYSQLGREEAEDFTPKLISSITIPIKAVSAGEGYSLLLDVNGQIWSFGDNSNGALGLGDKTDRTIPTLITHISAPTTAISAGFGHSLLIS